MAVVLGSKPGRYALGGDRPIGILTVSSSKLIDLSSSLNQKFWKKNRRQVLRCYSS